jgi:type I restriction enzyme S subunit
MQKAVSSTVTSIRKPMVEGFVIPVPPLDVQNKVVRILDTFTALTEEVTAELTARKKQYEYYRDNLLTFKELSK